MSLLAELDEVFGPDALADALFYQHSPALRFELAGGETPVAQFLRAIDRARAVLDTAFAGVGELTAVLRLWDDHAPPPSWQAARLWRRAGATLQALGVESPAAVPELRVQHTTGNDAPHWHFAFTLPAARVPELLWGVLAADSGFSPALVARVTLVAPALGVLACPYDSRGLDLVGPNQARLARLYRQFSEWLPDHDRARMAEIFSPRPDTTVTD